MLRLNQERLLKISFIALLSLIFLSSCAKKNGNAQNIVKPLYVKYEKASLGEIKQQFETAGELKADKEILVSAERPGKVEAVYVTEGGYANAGAPLIKIQGEDVDADLMKAQADYDSYKKLYEAGAISKQQLIGYESTLKHIESQRRNLSISAISSGMIGQIYVDPGDYVKAGDPLLDLVKIYPLRVSYSIPEKLIAKLKIGQPAFLTTDSEPGTIFESVVDFISPRVEPNTRAILVRAKITNPSNKLKANQFVKVKQVIENLTQVLLVKEEAVYLDQGQEFLYLAIPNKDYKEGDKPKTNPDGSQQPTHTAKRVPVKTGLREEGKVEITEGIQEGDNVIYAGLYSIYPGANLIIVEE